MASGKRFKFQGSKIRINTGVATGKTITAVTKANPAVVSSAAHGLPVGTVGTITGVVGMTELNGRLLVVDNPAAGDFQLAGVNSTGYAAYVSGGSFQPLVFSDFCELTGVNQQDGQADEIEVTTICSTAKEFEIGLADGGTLTLDFNLAPNTDIQTRIRASKANAEVISIQLTFPNSGGIVLMFGRVTQTSFTGQSNGVYTGSATLKLTEQIMVLAAAA